MAVITFISKGKKMYFGGYSDEDGEPIFVKSKSKALKRQGGFFVQAEIDQLKFYFKEKYPELENAESEE